MGKILHFDANRPFSNATALERICALWAEGNYIPSPYAENRMLQRGFDDADVAHLIMVTGGVKSHRKVEGLWRYTVRGKSVDGKGMTAVFEIQGNFMVLVTVF
jgi:hypothetical protein